MYNTPIVSEIKVPYVSKRDAVVNSTRSVDRKIIGYKQGEKVANWKEKVAKGIPASSPYTLDRTDLVLGNPRADKQNGYQFSWPATKYTSAFDGYPGAYTVPAVVTHLPVSVSKARSVALSKLYKKLESDRSELNAMATLAEFTDVIRQFGRPFGAIVDAFTRHEHRLYFERRRLVGSKTWKDEKFSKIAADTWLETSFGLLPLISDAETLGNAFGRFEHELLESPRLRDRMKSRALDSQTTETTNALLIPLNLSFGHYVVTRKTTEARCQYTVGLQGEVRAAFGSNERLLEILGLEPRNIPLALWEVTPWSWLVDYGTNVQQILQAAATITSRVNWIVLSEMTQTVLSLMNSVRFNTAPSTWPATSKEVASSTPVKGKGGVYLANGDMQLIRTTFTRSIPTELGVPPLIIKSPFGDLKKTANLLALAVSRSGKAPNWLD